MEFIHTPEERFLTLKDYPYKPNYQVFEGLRMHYTDEGSGEPLLCLHGEPTWGYLYRNFIKSLSHNYRVLVPDLIGFGKCDKPLRIKDYSYSLHFRSIQSLIESLNLREITLVMHDWGGITGLGLLGQYPHWFKRIIILNTFLPRGSGLPLPLWLWKKMSIISPVFPVGLLMKIASYKACKNDPSIVYAYQAPFPTEKHKAGVHAFPRLLPDSPYHEAIPHMKEAGQVLKKWEKPAQVLFSTGDIFFRQYRDFFINLIPGVNKSLSPPIKKAGHFLQEDQGEEVIRLVKTFLYQNQ